MEAKTRHDGSFAVARCFIQPGETINVESGAMYQQTMGMQITSEMQGGFLGALKRSLLSGDSFFVSKFTAPNGGWVDVVPNSPGDVAVLEVDPGEEFILTRGAWLASSETVKLDTSFGGGKMFLGGEGLWTVKCSGQGKLIIAAYGAMDQITLGKDEGVTIDTGHLVAYEAGMQVSIRKAGQGILSSLKSGEGLVMDFYGPGTVITQTRNPAGLAAFLIPLLPSRG